MRGFERWLTNKVCESYLESGSQWLNGWIEVVTSGVPQGPMLLNIFSNDTDIGIKYILIKFVYDDKLCDKINMTEGCHVMQKDLAFSSGTKRTSWGSKKSKCKVLHMDNGNQPCYQYKSKDIRTEHSPAKMGIKVPVDSKLDTNQQCTLTGQKATPVLDCTKRIVVSRSR